MRLIPYLFIMNLAFAALPQIKTGDISGSYALGKGEALAISADYKFEFVTIKHDNLKVQIKGDNNFLFIKDQNTTVKIDYRIFFLELIDSLEFSGLKIDSSPASFFIENHKATLKSGGLYVNIDGLSTKLIAKEGFDTTEDDFLEAFIHQSSLFMDQFFLVDRTNAAFISYIKETFKVDLSEEEVINRVRFNDLAFNVDNGNFKLFGKYASMMNIRLRGFGTTSYDKKTKILRFNISSLKVGIFGIKNLFLNLVKGLSIPNTTVNGDSIQILIDL